MSLSVYPCKKNPFSEAKPLFEPVFISPLYTVRDIYKYTMYLHLNSWSSAVWLGRLWMSAGPAQYFFFIYNIKTLNSASENAALDEGLCRLSLELGLSECNELWHLLLYNNIQIIFSSSKCGAWKLCDFITILRHFVLDSYTIIFIVKKMTLKIYKNTTCIEQIILQWPL